MSIEELFSKVSTFTQEPCAESINSSFFEVQLLKVESFRNYIFDIQRIKQYLVQVAPLPFAPEHFSFHDQVKQYLFDNVPQYGEYNITLNDEQLFRPYSNELQITSKRNYDQLKSVELFSLKAGDTILAHGWYGHRKDFLGAIRKGAAVSGLRVKVGNLQVGDQHLLDRCFRENRFNSYVVGEIHICNQALRPNSRRDDFVDNKEKTLLFNSIERELGLPLSKEIRLRSRISSQPSNLHQQPQNIGTLPEEKLKKCNVVQIANTATIPHESSARVLKKLLDKCGECQTLQQILASHQN